ncbi:hypothetical protein [Pseudomonas sp. Ga0074129]|nr:hypothetical protein [Pseudomonas sp. Ga0074129]
MPDNSLGGQHACLEAGQQSWQKRLRIDAPKALSTERALTARSS